MLHDLFIGIAFIAMVGAPAMVATLGGKKEYEPEPEPQAIPRLRNAKQAEPGKVIHPHSADFAPSKETAAGVFAPPPTLPVRARGMMNR